MTTKKILINGQWVNGEDRIVEIRSPHNNELIANVSHASKSQMEEALETASSSFKIVKDLPAHLISNALLTIRDFIKDNSDRFTKALAIEAGKPIKIARVEVDRALHTFETASGEAVRL